MVTVKFLENEVFEKLQKEKNLYSPLTIIDVSDKSSTSTDKGIDGFIQLAFKQRNIKLLIEIKNRTAPQVVALGVNNLRSFIDRDEYKGYFPTLIVPYLSESVIEILEKNKLCGLDLNGNYYIVIPDFVAIRLDKPNLYKESFYIKDVYSRNSSIVPRFLLRKNTPYRKISDIYEGIKTLGGTITLSTVSKVLKNLGEQIIISRAPNFISLVQPDKLLLNLKNNYIPPLPQKILKLNLPQERLEAKRILTKYFGTNWIWAGESSAEFYASTTQANEYTVYTKNSYNNDELLLKYENNRFYNYTVLILPSSADYVFFDSCDNRASKIQTYLELFQLDKREREIAQDIEKDILNEFRR